MNQPQFLLKTEQEQPDFALLVMEPLDKGYAHTLGNALRRTLLTSIKGAAITQVRIEGVKHMFSTLNGMKEDVVELILQLKEINVRYEGDDPIEITLEKKGPGVVTAGDIELPAGVEIMNKDLVLAHLADAKSKLAVTMTLETGYGYVASEERKITQVGVIPMDASFSPIKRVRFDVKETRVGRRTDFDKLLMEVWTDGTIAPAQAVTQAAEILIGYFNQIVNPVIPEKAETSIQSVEELEVMKLTVEELDLPTRIANALRKGGYKTVKDLSQATREEIAKVKNLGGKSVDVVVEKIEAKGVSLKG